MHPYKSPRQTIHDYPHKNPPNPTTTHIPKMKPPSPPPIPHLHTRNPRIRPRPRSRPGPRTRPRTRTLPLGPHNNSRQAKHAARDLDILILHTRCDIAVVRVDAHGLVREGDVRAGEQVEGRGVVVAGDEA
jgi:hypothetical protein